MMNNEFLIVRRVLKASAIATFLIGLSLLLYANQVVGIFGDWGKSQHFATYLGSALIGFSVSNWLYSRIKDLAVILPLIYGNLVSLLIASVIDAYLLLQMEVTNMVWLVLLLHLCFAVAFGYCLKILKHT